MATTRLSLDGYAARRAGSFAGRVTVLVVQVSLGDALFARSPSDAAVFARSPQREARF